jgi:hypothetical protein
VSQAGVEREERRAGRRVGSRDSHRSAAARPASSCPSRACGGTFPARPGARARPSPMAELRQRLTGVGAACLGHHLAERLSGAQPVALRAPGDSRRTSGGARRLGDGARQLPSRKLRLT